MKKNQLDIKIAHGLFERYELYIDSKKQEVKKRGSVTTSTAFVEEGKDVEITLHRSNILEKWYWFICLFNFINFFSYFRFGFYHKQAYYDADHCLYKIILKRLDFYETPSVDIEVENRDHNEKGYIKTIRKIETKGIDDLECKRLPPCASYGARWKAVNICSFVIYVVAFYVLLAIGLVNGNASFGFGEGFTVALTLIMSVYIIISVSKKKSSFDNKVKAKTVWEQK